MDSHASAARPLFVLPLLLVTVLSARAGEPPPAPGPVPDPTTTGPAVWRTAVDNLRAGIDARKRGDATASARFAEARKVFRAVAQNPADVNVDFAWEYLVTVDVIEEKYQDAVAAAEQAEAWWTSAAAKTQEEESPNVRVRRAPHRARTAYYRAEALKGLGQWDAVLEALRTFTPEAGQTFPQRALALEVEAHLAGERIAEADAVWQRLLALDPRWGGLANVARRFAGYYTVQYKDIEAEYKKVDSELSGKDGINQRLARAAKTANAAADAAVDKTGRRQTLERMLRLGGRGGGALGGAPALRQQILDLQKEIAADQETVKRAETERAALETQKAALDARRDELRRSLYGPLTNAARYYKQWDDALKTSGMERYPDNLVTFAYMFYYAATLEPAAPENWAHARQLYEDYLAHPKVKELPPTDAKKRGAVAKLGDIYVHFAEKEENPGVRRSLAAKAVDFLQDAIANRPENNPLVVGLLAGEYVALPWDAPVLQRMVRIPMKRVSDVAAFKAAVQTLGKEGGFPLPRLANEREQRAYLEAVDRFRAFVAKEPDARFERTVEALHDAEVDWLFYRELADISGDFRLSLAWSYSESGRVEDVQKALALSESLVDSPLEVEEESAEWWSAYTLRLKSYLAAAEAAGSGPGAPSGTAGTWIDRAKVLLERVANTYPDLGDASRPGTRQEWQALLQRLNRLATLKHLQPLALDLSRR